jgi:glycosyltransferase involved in cell wall biosynthesis
MKLVAVLTERPSAGGGYNQALSAILQLQRICAGRHRFEVVCTHADNLAVLRELGLPASHQPLHWVDRALALLGGGVFWQSLHRRFRFKGPFERALSRLGCDLACFSSPSSIPMSLQAIGYITSLWDICHLEHPEFPEVRDFHTIALRERGYRAVLRAAVLVIVDSPRLAELAAFHYRLVPERILIMPFAPAPQLLPYRDLPGEPDCSDAVAGGGRVGEEAPFFYPANLWPHKNHIRILQALVLLKQQGWRPRVVFCGHDQGNQAHLQAFVTRHGLDEQVQFIGFVDTRRLADLYRSALAVVMPTYFGQTNLPPLEAWTLGAPLIYSASFAAQAGDAALLVDIDDAQSLAAAMTACRDPEVRARLRAAGTRRLASIADERRLAEQALAARIEAFSARRQCWGGGEADPG